MNLFARSATTSSPLSRVWDSEGLETSLVADVHTDSNSGMVLEEGTGG